MGLRVAFMGTPEFSVPALRDLLSAGHNVVSVYSQPPRKSGRGQKINPSPVHAFAAELGLDVRTPVNFKRPDDVAAFQALKLDVAVVVAYGLLLPQIILDAPRLGCLNLHASLLPRWRGAAPIQRAIMAGDKETGIMVMQMEAGLDTGPVLFDERLTIDPRETSGSLHERLSEVGGPLIVRALSELEGGALAPQPQSRDGVTYASKVSKDEARIDWSRTAWEIDALIRGLSPFPGAWTQVPSEKGPVRLKVLEATPVKGHGRPSEIIAAPLIIACGSGALKVTRVQRAGKSACDVEEFIRGNSLSLGTSLDRANDKV